MTRMLHAILAEDEAPQREALSTALKSLWPELNIVLCEDGIAALEAIAERMPDVAFLDIRMPGVSGLDVAAALKQRAHIVFTTAFDEFAIKAFDTGAVDYLLKPIRPQRLAEAAQRLRQRIDQQPAADVDTVLASLRRHLLPPPGRDKLRWITASLGDTTRLLPIDEVLYFQAQEKYTRVVTADVEALIRTPLRELLEALDPQQFWQIHRGAIVRADAVDRVRRDELGKWQLWLRGRNECLPLSAAFQNRFKAM